MSQRYIDPGDLSRLLQDAVLLGVADGKAEIERLRAQAEPKAQLLDLCGRAELHLVVNRGTSIWKSLFYLQQHGGSYSRKEVAVEVSGKNRLYVRLQGASVGSGQEANVSALVYRRILKHLELNLGISGVVYTIID